MNRELAQNRSNNVDVEDVWLRSLFAKSFHDSSSRNAQEANRHEHSTDSILSVTKFDALEIQDRQRVGADKAVQCENLVHLDRGNKRATALTNDIRDSNNVAKLRGEGRGNRGIAQFQSRRLIITHFSFHHASCQLIGQAGGLLVDILLAVV